MAFLALFLWAAFTVKLGRFTFAEHFDRIGQTEEAQELLDGTRARVRPGLEEVKQRMLGEYVEAPTHLAVPASPSPSPSPISPARPAQVPVATSTVARGAGGSASPASTADANKLPGRRKGAHDRLEP